MPGALGTDGGSRGAGPSAPPASLLHLGRQVRGQSRGEVGGRDSGVPPRWVADPPPAGLGGGGRVPARGCAPGGGGAGVQVRPQVGGGRGTCGRAARPYLAISAPPGKPRPGRPVPPAAAGLSHWPGGDGSNGRAPGALLALFSHGGRRLACGPRGGGGGAGEPAAPGPQGVSDPRGPGAAGREVRSRGEGTRRAGRRSEALGAAGAPPSAPRLFGSQPRGLAQPAELRAGRAGRPLLALSGDGGGGRGCPRRSGLPVRRAVPRLGPPLAGVISGASFRLHHSKAEELRPREGAPLAGRGAEACLGSWAPPATQSGSCPSSSLGHPVLLPRTPRPHPAPASGVLPPGGPAWPVPLPRHLPGVPSSPGWALGQKTGREWMDELAKAGGRSPVTAARMRLLGGVDEGATC